MRPRFIQHWVLFPLALIANSLASADDLANFVTPNELDSTRAWFQAHFQGKADALPFSFQYGENSSDDLLAGWEQTSASKSLDAKRTQHTMRYTDPQTGLVVRCVAVEYHDFSAVEWTLYFHNSGKTDTPILADISPLDVQLHREGDAEYVLHHNKGSRATGTDYEPYETVLGLNEEVTLRTIGGRPSNGALPYFNIAWPTPQHGVLLAIGWPGQWQAEFRRDEAKGLRVKGGQEATHFTLHPGEEVRSPLIALLWYEGDWLRGQNIWRRWMVQHNLPRTQGELLSTQLLACSSHQFSEMLKATEENQKFFIDRYLEEKLPLAYWWMDAGWYINNGTWANTGTWEVDRQRFPNGLRAITDHGRARAVKSIVWFEPERVTSPSWLVDNHPDWLLTPPPKPPGPHYNPSWRLLNLGNPEALSWVTDHIDQLIKSEGIDLYRQDFNVDPLHFWKANDTPDRQGITEIKYVTGYLAFWDALLDRNDGLRIDSCASGGRRNDLETVRRSVPLLRSDQIFEPHGQQCHTYGISIWLPYHGTGTMVGRSAIGQHGSETVDVYAFRSQMAPSMTACWDMRNKELDYDTLRKLAEQHQRAAPNYLGDFYPLTPYAPSDQLDVWMAWQWARPELGEGVVHAFRRADSNQSHLRFKLRGLDPDATYLVEDADQQQPVTRSGKQLMEEGMKIELAEAPQAALIFYHKQP
jgi:alpha-galactosidase